MEPFASHINESNHIPVLRSLSTFQDAAGVLRRVQRILGTSVNQSLQAKNAQKGWEWGSGRVLDLL